MRAVIQRVNFASVLVGEERVGSIGQGLLILLGIGKDDTENDIKWLVDKVIHLRIFNDENEKMNHSVLETKGELLIVSQFTLYGDLRKGRRPDYTEAAHPEKAKTLYEKCVDEFKQTGLGVKTGIFAARMKVSLENDGPVTLLLDSRKEF